MFLYSITIISLITITIANVCLSVCYNDYFVISY